MKLAGLSEAQVAHLSIHGSLEGFVALAPTPDPKAAADAKAVAEAALAETARLAAEKTTADAATAEAARVALAASATDSDVVKFLRGEITAKDTQILDLTVKSNGLTEKLAASETTHSALVDIARGAVSNLRVALGGSAGDAATLSDLAVVTAHKDLSATFKDKFKVGGVAAVETGAEAKSGINDSKYLAVVQAASKK